MTFPLQTPSFRQRATVAGSLAFAALLAASLPAHASENYRMRQSPVNTLGGEMAADLDNPGFAGTAALTRIWIDKVTDSQGNGISTPTGGKITSGPLTGFTQSAPANPIQFKQTQTQLNLIGRYTTAQTFGGGRLSLAVNVPLIEMKRSFSGALGAGSLSSPTGITLPAADPRTAAANAAAASRWSALVAAQNDSVSGLGDTEVSAVWLRHADRLKIAAGASLFLPTGSYDKNRGPNPGFGNFQTVRIGAAATYSLNPNLQDSSWDKGVTVAGRLAWGTNTRNKDTDYRSGDFVFGEVGVVKVAGDWAFGANLLTTQQITSDTGPVSAATCLGGVDANGCRYRTYGAGAFAAYKLPVKDAGFNVQYSQNFGGRNAIVVNALQVRLVKAW